MLVSSSVLSPEKKKKKKKKSAQGWCVRHTRNMRATRLDLYWRPLVRHLATACLVSCSTSSIALCSSFLFVLQHHVLLLLVISLNWRFKHARACRTWRCEQPAEARHISVVICSLERSSKWTTGESVHAEGMDDSHSDKAVTVGSDNGQRRII